MHRQSSEPFKAIVMDFYVTIHGCKGLFLIYLYMALIHDHLFIIVLQQMVRFDKLNLLILYYAVINPAIYGGQSILESLPIQEP